MIVHHDGDELVNLIRPIVIYNHETKSKIRILTKYNHINENSFLTIFDC
mgnify:CR=1 FL=1